MIRKKLEQRPLKHWRVLNDLTQEQLGEKVGVTGRTISLYETNSDYFKGAKFKTVEKIAKELNIYIDQIIF